MLQTNGNGVLGTIASIGGSTFTMANMPGSLLVYYNRTIQVYDPTLTTNRGSRNVTAVDPVWLDNQRGYGSDRDQRERRDRSRQVDVGIGVAVCKHCSAILDEKKAAKHGLGAGAEAVCAKILAAKGVDSGDREATP